MKPPVNMCDIKIDVEMKHEGGHYLKLKFNWISVDPETKEITFPVTDTGYLRDWTLIQIEGEEPMPDDATTDQYQSQSKGSKAPAKKTPATGKNAKVVALEEITDNRPRVIKYRHDCAELNNGIGLEVTEDVGVAFS